MLYELAPFSLLCANMYARTGHLNIKYNKKCNGLALAVCKCKPWLKQTLINNYHWFNDPKFCMQYIEIFQRWCTKIDLSISECTMWYSQWMPQTESQSMRIGEYLAKQI